MSATVTMLPTGDAANIPVFVTHTIKADLAARGVFPQIREAHATSRLPNGEMYAVSGDLLRALIKDAMVRFEELRSGDGPRGTRVAYGMHACRLRERFRQCGPTERGRFGHQQPEPSQCRGHLRLVVSNP